MRTYDQEAHAPLLGVRIQRLLLAPLVFAARHRRAAMAIALMATVDSPTSSKSPNPLDTERDATGGTMVENPQEKPTLVLGGTGKTGRRAVERLQARGIASEVLDGRNAALADGVQRASGHQARDFADYARDTAATGICDA